MRRRRQDSPFFSRLFSRAATTLLAAALAVALAEWAAGLALNRIGAMVDSDGADFKAPSAPLSQDLTAPGRKVFVFGGNGDPRLPAALETALGAAGASDVRVFGLGAPHHASADGLAAFQRLLADGIKPDVAVFIDGPNDLGTCAAAERAANGSGLAASLARTSSMVRLARHLAGDNGTAADPECASPARIEQAVLRLDANRRLMDAAAERFGVAALLVHQPLAAPSPDAAKGYGRAEELHAAGRTWDRNVLWPGADTDLIQAMATAIASHFQDGGQTP